MKIKKKIKNILKLFLLIILVCIVVLIINIVINKNIFITKYQIENNKISESFDEFKIVQITDVHSIRNTKQKNNIIKNVKKINPDVIFLIGDLIDATYYTEENEKYKNGEIDFPDKLTYNLIEEFTDISEVYFVYGNHEMMLLDNPENNVFKIALEEAGVKILNNSIDEIEIDGEKIQILGVQDPATLYKDKKYAYIGNNNHDRTKQILDDLFSENELDKNKFTICLAHRPEYFDLYEKYNIDLVLSGHTHGGIVRLPFIGGIYAHPQGWFPEISSGMYEKENLKMIVSRGLGYSTIPIRIFNPPEIIEIILNFT